MARTLSSAQVAAHLNVSAATIQRQARLGVLPHDQTPGGHRRFDLDEVRRALEEANTEAQRRRPASARVAVLTALSVEFEAVLRLLGPTVTTVLPNGTRIYTGKLISDTVHWTISVTELGEGNLTAATETTRLLENLRPNLVLFVGVAGGLKPDIRHGDVVVASRVVTYQAGKSAEEFLPRQLNFPTSHRLVQLVKEIRRLAWTTQRPKPEVHVRPIAAGETVVASHESVEFERISANVNDAYAVDMESIGVYSAVHSGARPVAALAVRGVSDMIGDKTPTADMAWQPIAAQNAADFAIALLRGARPEDVGADPPEAEIESELDEQLAHLPPPCATLLRDISLRGSATARAISEMLADPDPSPADAVQFASDHLATLDTDEDELAQLWIALGEFAASHGLGNAAADFFLRAAPLSPDSSRWRSRAALACGNDDPARALDLVTSEDGNEDGDEALLRQAILFALRGQEEELIALLETEPSAEIHATFLYIRALAGRGRRRQAIDFAEREISKYPNASMAAGLSLMYAALLVDEIDTPTAGTALLDLADRARGIALKVRDWRRAWGGPSAEAVAVAMRALFAASDYEAAIRLAMPGPDGEATGAEANDEDVAQLGAMGSLRVQNTELARKFASRVNDPLNQASIIADIQRIEGDGAASIESLQALASNPDLDSQRLYRALLGLAAHGKTDEAAMSRLAAADDVKPEIVRARLESAEGDHEAAIRRLRALSGDDDARAMLIEAYMDAGKAGRAIDELQRWAVDTQDPKFELAAIEILRQEGRSRDALKASTELAARVPSTSGVSRHIRRVILQLCLELQDWRSMVIHATAAIEQGDRSDSTAWAKVYGLYQRREATAALQSLDELKCSPRTPVEAKLAIQLFASDSGDQRAERVSQILAIAELFPASEDVVGAACGAAFEVSRDVELSLETVSRLQALTEQFFQTWPESNLLKRIDASDIDNLFEFLRSSFSEISPELQDLAAKVALGQAPLAALSEIRGRGLLQLLVTNVLGGTPIGTVDPALSETELAAAIASLDGGVVMDVHSLYVVFGCLSDPSLSANFDRLLVAESTRDDILNSARSLSLRSTGTIGWDPRADRPFLHEVAEEEADRWHTVASLVAGSLDGVEVRPDVPSRYDELRNDMPLVLSSIELAAAQGFALWSDDPGIRVLAAAEGVSAFGTLTLIRALASLDLLQLDAVGTLRKRLARCRLVDLGLTDHEIEALAKEEGYRADIAAFALSRPQFWLDPVEAHGTYRKCVARAPEDDESLGGWAFAATMGIARSSAPHARRDLAAMIILTGAFSRTEGPSALPQLLDGARIACEQIGLPDPLADVASHLKESLGERLDPALVPAAFTRIVGSLRNEDRLKALEVLIAPD